MTSDGVNQGARLPRTGQRMYAIQTGKQRGMFPADDSSSAHLKAHATAERAEREKCIVPKAQDQHLGLSEECVSVCQMCSGIKC
jgi:hypothetical protein